MDARLVCYHLPVNQLPPRLGIGKLAAGATLAHTPVQQPRVLPGVEAQQRLKVDTAGGQVTGSRPVPRAKDAVTEVVAGSAALAGRVHVSLLGAPVGTWVGRAGEVGGQEAVVAGAGADEPDEARAEHGGGGEDELTAQGLDGGERKLKLGLEGVGHGGPRGCDAVEEEVGVVRHRGPIEDWGLVGLTGRHEGDGLCILVLKFGAWSKAVLGQLSYLSLTATHPE